jgi:predicted secreted protein
MQLFATKFKKFPLLGMCLALIFSGNSAEAASKLVTRGDDGQIIKIAKGSTFSLSLDSSYWSLVQLKKSATVKEIGGVLSEPIAPSPTAPPGCTRLGSGCATLTWKFMAKKLGSTKLVATRELCGEALACAPEEQNFSVTIKVIAKRVK